jgi:anti-sigma regulatory factor (Ser/Thr protein kinase)
MGMTAPLGDTFERAICVPVVEESQVGASRRRAAALADALDLDETERGRVGVIVTEAATNLVRHARDGVLVIQPVRGARAGIEVISIDRGPGMRDPARCLQDGYSTGGTGGTGLGAIKRMSSEFDIDSKVGAGTVVVARVWRDHESVIRGTNETAFGGICTPIIGEDHIGDGWSVKRSDTAFAIMVADGLGHGVEAERPSRLAVEVFLDSALDAPSRVIERAHDVLRGTRGAAVAVARVEGTEVRFAGVGNVAGSVVADAVTRHMVSHPGIVGHQMSRVQEFTYPWSDRSLLVMASDGIRTQWRLDDYPGINRRHPSLIAATVWRDFSRGRDDATVVVAQGPALR